MRMRGAYPRCSKRVMMGPIRPRWVEVSLCDSFLAQLAVRHTWTPSGLMAMKLQAPISNFFSSTPPEIPVDQGTHVCSEDDIFSASLFAL